MLKPARFGCTVTEGFYANCLASPCSFPTFITSAASRISLLIQYAGKKAQLQPNGSSAKSDCQAERLPSFSKRLSDKCRMGKRMAEKTLRIG